VSSFSAADRFDRLLSGIHSHAHQANTGLIYKFDRYRFIPIGLIQSKSLDQSQQGIAEAQMSDRNGILSDGQRASTSVSRLEK